jgi:leukotriene-A4 hydrolase
VLINGRALVWAWLALSVAVMAPRGAAGAEGTGGPRMDVHSYTRPDQVRVRNLDLELAVDFTARVLHGSVVLTVDRPPGAAADAPLVLDTKGLTIEAVETVVDRGDPAPIPFTLGRADPILGAPLSVQLPPRASRVRIRYRTTAASTALQWVDPKGTAGGKHPFLFSQSQAIHARSWIPLQDSPAVRVTYEAQVHVPPDLRAVMSADVGQALPGDRATTSRFTMPQPVAPYLIALAVGDLAFRPMSDHTGVWAEPSVVEAAAKEFADTAKMVAAAERRYGEYRWGRYDLLVLPPSFPFGGMENPKLTFATPTILAGDKSLVSLVAHELAHSWSGNLVTNATWSDFWLNEGFTTYIERRIIEDVYGPHRATMERVLGIRDLRDELKTLPPRDQVLHVDLTDRDPDDGMTRVPYEKGALFLTVLEKAFGRDRFDAFLRGYFDHFAFRSITTDDFVAYLREHLLKTDEAAARRIDLKAWLEQPGLPGGFPEPDATAFARVDAAARDWSAGHRPADRLETGDWSTQEWLRFLQSLPDPLPADRMAELDRACHLTRQGNSEIACQWLTLAVRNRYAPADPRLETFLTTIGRRKFLMPLYTELLKTPEGAARARAIFATAASFYHPIAASSVAKLLAPPTSQGN